MNPVWRELLRTPMVVYTPEEIKRIMDTLGESPAKFAERFKLSEDCIKAWITPIGKAKHRTCEGPAAVLMWHWAKEANERGCAKGNLIRLASRYHLENNRP